MSFPFEVISTEGPEVHCKQQQGCRRGLCVNAGQHTQLCCDIWATARCYGRFWEA